MAVQTTRSNQQIKLPFPHRTFYHSNLVIPETPTTVLNMEFGALWSGDYVELLPHFKSETVDTVFADPPFNF